MCAEGPRLLRVARGEWRSDWGGGRVSVVLVEVQSKVQPTPRVPPPWQAHERPRRRATTQRSGRAACGGARGGGCGGPGEGGEAAGAARVEEEPHAQRPTRPRSSFQHTSKIRNPTWTSGLWRRVSVEGVGVVWPRIARRRNTRADFPHCGLGPSGHSPALERRIARRTTRDGVCEGGAGARKSAGWVRAGSPGSDRAGGGCVGARRARRKRGCGQGALAAWERAWHAPSDLRRSLSASLSPVLQMKKLLIIIDDLLPAGPGRCQRESVQPEQAVR